MRYESRINTYFVSLYFITFIFNIILVTLHSIDTFILYDKSIIILWFIHLQLIVINLIHRKVENTYPLRDT